MKALLSLVILSTVSFSANALESFYGRTVQRGHVYTCVYENNSGVAQNMKYVVFNFDRVSGHSNSFDVKSRIDKVVADGGSLSEKTLKSSVNVNYCKYLAR